MHFQLSFRFIPKLGQITSTSKISAMSICIKISCACSTDNKCRYFKKTASYSTSAVVLEISSDIETIILALTEPGVRPRAKQYFS